jgi:transcriptional regulator with XRE-family HTH domain
VTGVHRKARRSEHQPKFGEEYTSLARWLTRYMSDHGITPQDLSDLSGVGLATVYRTINGETKPHPNTFYAMVERGLGLRGRALLEVSLVYAGASPRKIRSILGSTISENAEREEILTPSSGQNGG